MTYIALILAVAAVVFAALAITRFVTSRRDDEPMDWGSLGDEGHLNLAFEDDTLEDVESRYDTLSFEDERPRPFDARTSGRAEDVSWRW